MFGGGSPYRAPCRVSSQRHLREDGCGRDRGVRDTGCTSRVGRVRSASSKAAAAGCSGCASEPPYSSSSRPGEGMGAYNGVASPMGTRRSTGLRTHPGSACDAGPRTKCRQRKAGRLWLTRSLHRRTRLHNVSCSLPVTNEEGAAVAAGGGAETRTRRGSRAAKRAPRLCVGCSVGVSRSSVRSTTSSAAGRPPPAAPPPATAPEPSAASSSSNPPNATARAWAAGRMSGRSCVVSCNPRRAFPSAAPREPSRARKRPAAGLRVRPGSAL